MLELQEPCNVNTSIRLSLHRDSWATFPSVFRSGTPHVRVVQAKRMLFAVPGCSVNFD